MSEPDMQDLKRIYDATPREEPPAALDAAILAAAHREAGARPGGFRFRRDWGPPLAAAAAVVLTASLVLLTEREKPQLLDVGPPASDSAVTPQAERQQRQLQAPAQEPAAKPASPAPKPASPAPRARAEIAQPAPPAEPRRDASPAAEVPIASGAAREQSAQGAAASSNEMARSRAAPSAAKLEESPEAWLARIASLRQRGLSKEAEDSLAEFKRRYPDYPLPAAAQAK
jgi:type IV secretory pathway VirB10-like protein